MSGSLSRRRKLLEQCGLTPEYVPEHVAIIMDGNGRWARKRGLARIQGHREAVKAVRTCVETCRDLGINYLTLFAFSVDNWKRPKKEIDSLMGLLREFLRREKRTLVKNKIRFMVVGDIKGLSGPVQTEIEKVVSATKAFRRHHFILALNYGGRSDILQGVRKCAEKCVSREIDPNDITEELFSDCLYTHEIPDPDLLIRTSGEYRLSNFFLWQMSYTELWITPVLWPDFGREDLIEAVVAYSKRDRRYGGVLVR